MTVIAGLALVGTLALAASMAIRNRRRAAGYAYQPAGLQMQPFGGGQGGPSDSAVHLAGPPAGGYSDAPGHSRAAFNVASAPPGAPQPPAATEGARPSRLQF